MHVQMKQLQLVNIIQSKENTELYIIALYRYYALKYSGPRVNFLSPALNENKPEKQLMIVATINIYNDKKGSCTRMM